MKHDSMHGAEFGPYRIGRLLGRGGMGAVYEAYDTNKDRTVALKVLPADLADDERFTQRFRREAHTVARLQEPHIIPIHDYGEIDGRLFIDMRLVKGKDLRSLIAEGPLGTERALHLVGQIAEALDAAHTEGLVHRDVKPENILVTEHDFAYLVDFGIAVNEMETRLTGTGGTIGSTAYMAPERFRDDPITASADVYALTCVLYEAITAHSPLARRSVSAQIAAHLYEQPRLDAQVPEGFRDVIRRGLAKDPAQRYTDAGALVHAASAALAHPNSGSVTGVEPVPAISAHDVAIPDVTSQPTVLTGSAGAGSTPAPATGKNSRAMQVVLAAVAAVALVAAGALGVRALSGSDGDSAAASRPAPQTAAQTETSDDESTPENSTSSGTSGMSSSSTAGPTDGDSLARIEPTDDAHAQSILSKTRAADRKTSPLNGKWVAQVASQYVGVTDDSVQPTPMTLPDILRHHRDWRTDPRVGDAKVILVKENDFGQIEHGKPEIWITLIMIEKPTAQDGRDWCVSAFSMSEAESRKVCAVRQFVPAHE